MLNQLRMCSSSKRKIERVDWSWGVGEGMEGQVGIVKNRGWTI
jgi:hypothetical protein